MGKLSSKHKVVPFSESSYYIGPTNNQDELDGKGKFIDDFGNCYVGHFKNNNFNGYGIMNNQASYMNEMRVLPNNMKVGKIIINMEKVQYIIQMIVSMLVNLSLMNYMVIVNIYFQMECVILEI